MIKITNYFGAPLILTIDALNSITMPERVVQCFEIQPGNHTWKVVVSGQILEGTIGVLADGSTTLEFCPTKTDEEEGFIKTKGCASMGASSDGTDGSH